MLDKFLNFARFILTLFKANIKVTIAKSFLGSGIVLSLGGTAYDLTINTKDESIAIRAIDNTSEILLYIGIFLIIIGIILLINIYRSVKIHPILYFSPSLSNMSEEMPMYAVENQDKYSTIPQKIGPIDSYNKEIVIEEYKYIKKSFDKRIDHSESNKIYIAAIGSFPYMYLMGSLLRNGHINSLPMEYDNNSSKWKRLEEYGPKATNITLKENSSIDQEIDILANNTSNDVGIALCYTYKIFENTLPDNLINNTIYLKNSLGIGHYYLSFNDTQEDLISEILQYIHKLGKNGKRVHLFVSAQASFCVNLGKKYQDNVSGTVLLHNYDAEAKEYSWNIEFNQGEVF